MMIKKKIAVTLAIAAAGAVSVLGTGTASAGHCADDGPGSSSFGAHAKANGSGTHDEGDHRGWSSCQETSNNYVD